MDLWSKYLIVAIASAAISFFACIFGPVCSILTFKLAQYFHVLPQDNQAAIGLAVV